MTFRRDINSLKAAATYCKGLFVIAMKDTKGEVFLKDAAGNVILGKSLRSSLVPRPLHSGMIKSNDNDKI